LLPGWRAYLPGRPSHLSGCHARPPSRSCFLSTCGQAGQTDPGRARGSHNARVIPQLLSAGKHALFGGRECLPAPARSPPG